MKDITDQFIQHLAEQSKLTKLLFSMRRFILETKCGILGEEFDEFKVYTFISLQDMVNAYEQKWLFNSETYAFVQNIKYRDPLLAYEEILGEKYTGTGLKKNQFIIQDQINPETWFWASNSDKAHAPDILGLKDGQIIRHVYGHPIIGASFSGPIREFKITYLNPDVVPEQIVRLDTAEILEPAQ